MTTSSVASKSAPWSSIRAMVRTSPVAAAQSRIVLPFCFNPIHHFIQNDHDIRRRSPLTYGSVSGVNGATIIDQDFNDVRLECLSSKVLWKEPKLVKETSHQRENVSQSYACASYRCPRADVRTVLKEKIYNADVCKDGGDMKRRVSVLR
jgi:hypothetical protein